MDSKYAGEPDGNLAVLFVVGTTAAAIGLVSAQAWFWGLIMNYMVVECTVVFLVQMIVVVVFVLSLWERVRWVRFPPVVRVALSGVAIPGAMTVIGLLVGALVRVVQMLG